MKIRNFIFTGFMASILMAGAAYAEEPAPTVDQSGFLTTKSYVDDAARWAKNTATTAANEAISDTNEAVSALEGRVGDAEENITTLSGDMVEFNQFVGTLPDTATATTVVGYIDEKIGDLSTEQGQDISDLETRMGTAEENITNLQTSVSGLDDVVIEHGTSITSLTTTVGDSTGGLVKDVADNAADIETNATNIATNATDIDTLEATVNSTTSGLATKASQSALDELEATVGTNEETMNGHISDTDVHVTASQSALLDGLNTTLTSAELNVLDGVTATTTELNYVDGVTSNIQDQLDGKVAAADLKCSGSACYVDNNGALQTFSSISSWTDLTD